MTTISTATTTPIPATDPEGPKHSRPAPPPAESAATPPSTQAGDRSVSAWTMLAFIAGCALLVVAAINLPNLGTWGDEHGNVLVFLAFFLVMSIGGRWFWAGIDALWSAIGNKDNA